MLHIQGKYREGESLYTQVLNVQRRVLGPEHPDTLRSMNGLATVYSAQGKYAQAEGLESRVLESNAVYWAPSTPTL